MELGYNAIMDLVDSFQTVFIVPQLTSSMIDFIRYEFM